MTALSAVGAAFSAGVGVVAGAGVVCAAAAELNINAQAKAAVGLHALFPSAIAVSCCCRMISDLDHCEAGKACKLEINRRNGGAPGDWPHPWFHGRL